MSENYKIKRLYDFISNAEYSDSDYWYFSGKTDIINILKNFDNNDIVELESKILEWEIEKIEILIECFTYGFIDENTLNMQSYILTFLLANLQDESEKLDILENSSHIILKGEPKPIELLNSIINWIEINKYNETKYYSSHCLRIYEAKKTSIQRRIVKQKISELKQEISSLTKSMQAFDEIDGVQDKSINLLKKFESEDFEQLKTDLLLWENNELEILAKVFSRGDINGNLIDDDYFFGYLFVLLPALTSSILLDDLFNFFENSKIDCGLLKQIKNKLNELIAKRYIERNTYEYWSKQIIEKEKTCS